ncbi:Ribonuclease BN, tRNA processing enzyme [Alteribacillus persepolensis]|uniref:Ribonuclease BN, tRNA processing enzyme n=1 Tax=Alteribacillus persepolensis TaxID=568899 RepID=A0A1G8A7F0_9BACI|nr:MBL fold metallo-hydrolase [Alteribacillus persepolensis]SDH16777.1 Ribonuclease BN, tRNA processing enzyme [Alteribacillus persepolensis]
MNITLTMLGTGSPRPTLERSSPAQIIQADDQLILIDCGYNTFNQLLKVNIRPNEITHLFMTHLHADHALDYAHFLITGWAQGRRKLTVIGPKGMKKFHRHVLEMFSEDIDYRMSLGRPADGVKENVTIIEIEEPGDIDLPLGFERITAEQMVHNVLTYGFRFETGDKTIAVAGDTAPTESVPRLAKEADVFVLDACLAANKYDGNNASKEVNHIWEQLQKEHCTPKQCGELAQEANASTLVLTHFLPGVDTKKAYEEAKKEFEGEVIVPSDLQTIHV